MRFNSQNNYKGLKMKTNTKLKVGFWFGLNKPKMCGDNYFSYEFNENNLIEQYKNFELSYEKFKIRNTNPIVPYKNTLQEEECIFIYENEKIVETNFIELFLIVEELKKIEMRINDLNKSIEKDIYNLNTFMENISENNMNTVSINQIFSQDEIKIIESLYKKSSNERDLRDKLKTYFKTIRHSLNKRGFDYNYLSLVLSYSIMKNI